MAKTVKLRCPICKKAVQSTSPDFPFCSDHCRSIDVGKWATGGYVISSPVGEGGEAAINAILDEEEG